MPLLDALTFVRKKRPIVFPNPGFQKQLHDFERKLKTQRLKVTDQNKSASPAPSKFVSDAKLKPLRHQMLRVGGSHSQLA